MKPNVDQCKAIHTVESNPSFTYKMMGCEVTMTTEEGHQGVMTNCSMKILA